MTAVLQAVATANPPLYVTQREAWAIFDARFDLQPRERDLYRRILLEGPIEGRYVGMDSTAEAGEEDQDRLVARFLVHGRRTATEAAHRALQRAGMSPAEVGALVVNTCTGYLCPGLSSYVAEDLGLGPSVRPLDLMGMGCGAALPNLQAAHDLVCANPEIKVLSIAVEICSATLFMDPDPGVVASNCIFGDGAAACVVTGGEPAAGRPALLDFESVLLPQYRAHLQYRTERHRLRNVLSREVPVIGARAIEQAVGRLLARNGVDASAIDHWIVHAGGTQVLDAVQRRLGLSAHQLRHAHAVFRAYGNMSSPTALFVLDRVLEQDKPQHGEQGLILTFGAGFTAFAALVGF
jgi:predicted naringenin-chalcone synthase